MAEAARWYLVLVLIGAGGVLPTSLLFGGLRSGGVLYARPFALLLVAEAAWLISAETPLRYGLPLILGLIVVLWVWSALLAWRRPALLGALRRRVALLVVGEAICLALFVLCAFVRAQAPNATDTEKPMDLMLISSARSASAMPTHDLWFGGVGVSYYHLGPVMVDVVGRVARVAVGPEFTLGVATAGALAGMAVFALAGDVLALSPLRQRASVWIAGGVAVVSLLFVSTFEGVLDLLSAQGVGPTAMWAHLGIDGLPGPALVDHGVPTQFWWWFRASRVIPGTITEFPAFSIVLGDLHAHLIALPLGVVAVATALPTFAGRTPLTWTVWRRHPGAWLLAGALFSGLAMTNTWDALIYGGLWAGAALCAATSAGWQPHAAVMLLARYFMAPIGLAAVLAWPFFSSLQSTNFGVTAFDDRGSDPVRFLIVWFPLLLPLAVGVLLLRPRVRRDAIVIGVAVACMVVLAWIAFELSSGRMSALVTRGSGWYVLALLVAAFGAASAATAAAIRARDTAQAGWLGLAAAAAAVVLGTELFYIVDAFANRMNTVFKFWYGAWVLLAVAGAVAVGMAFDRKALVRMPDRGPYAPSRPPRNRKQGGSALAVQATPATANPAAQGGVRWPAIIAVAMALVLYGACLLWAPAAAYARSREGQTMGIDSLAYLDRTDPGAAGAVRWAHEHLTPHDILLEAVGEDYGEGSRISASSGIATLLGWPGHELQWRGNIPALGERRIATGTIYRDGATEEAKQLARDQGVTYIYLGREERAQFGEDIAMHFAAWTVVFDNDGSRIVQVPQ